MKGRKNIGSLKQALSLLFAVVMVLGLFNGLSTRAEAPESKFVYETVGLEVAKKDPATQEPIYHEVVKNGEAVEGRPDIYVGDTARIIYKFKVTDQISSGDSFSFDLPKNEYLKGLTYTIAILDKGRQIGYFTTNDAGKVTVTFTNDSGGIKDGVLAIQAAFIKEDESFSYSFGNPNKDIIIPIKANSSIPSTSKPAIFDPNKFVASGIPTDNFLKYELGGGTKVGYIVELNNKDRARIYDVNYAKNGSFNKIKNFMFYDELPEGMEYTDLLDIKVRIDYPAYENGKMTDNKISLNNFGPLYDERLGGIRPTYKTGSNNITKYHTTSVKDQVFLTIERSSDGTWEAFQEHVKNQTPPYLGIWKKKKMIGNLGSFPSETVNYEDLFGGVDKFKEYLQVNVDRETVNGHDQVKISKEQKERIEEVYIGQGVISYLLEYQTELTGVLKEKYVNTAKFKADFDDTITKTATHRKTIGYGFGEELEETGNTIIVENKWIGPSDSSRSATVELYDDTDGTNFVKQSHNFGATDENYSFTGLNKIVNGKQANYKVRVEPALSDYRSMISKVKEDKKFIVTHIKQRNIPVKVEWKEHDGSSLTTAIPNDVDVLLYAGASEDDSSPVIEGEKPLKKTITISDFTTAVGTTTFEKLDEYFLNGSEVVYLPKLDNIPKGFTYNGVWDSGTYVITLTRKDTTTLKRDIPVKVVWRDHNNSVISDPSKLSQLPELPIGVYKTDENNESNLVTSHTFNKTEGWEKKIENLPYFDSTKEILEYKLKVKNQPNTPLTEGYDFRVQGNMETGFEVVARLKTVDLKVVKVWKDKEQKEIEATDQLPKVTVKLHKDNDTAPIKTAIIGFFDGWFKVFKKLPLFEGSRKILYSLKEDKVAKVDGYEEFVSDISFDEANHQFTVVNHEPYPSSGGGWIGGGGSDSDLNKDKDKEKEKEKDKEKENDKKDKGEEDKDKTEPIVDIINPSVIPSLPTIQEIKEEDEKKLIIPEIDIEDSETALSATDIPETPSLLAVKEEEIPELLLDGDEVPLGDTELTYDEEGNLVTWKRGDKSRESKGYPILAKTGGLSVSFIPLLLLLSLVGALSFLMFYRRKRES